MSESHLAQVGPSSDLVPRPDVNTKEPCHPSIAHPGRPWIRTGRLAKLPVELIYPICARLCVCWHCEPRENILYYGPPDQVKFRNTLDSLSRTCRFLCSVAQPYLFHALDTTPPHIYHRGREHDSDLITIHRFRRIATELPHVVSQIRRITLNSTTDDLPTLRHLTGLKTLRLLRSSTGGEGHHNNLFFPCVSELFYGPQLHDTHSSEFPGHKVGLEDAREDLKAILDAAPRLSHLYCYRLWHDVTSSSFIALNLPGSHITTLDLRQCWLPHATFKKFMANFPLLKNFRLFQTMPAQHVFPLPGSPFNYSFPAGGPERIADATDVTEALEPCKESLEALIIDFGCAHHENTNFRNLLPMNTFTSLKKIKLHQDVIGRTYSNKEIFLKFFPSSIEFLGIVDFNEDFGDAILEFAKHVAEGEYPNLKRVCLDRKLHSQHRILGSISGQSFLSFANGQDVLRVEEYRSVFSDRGGIDINPHQRLPGEGGEEEADDREVSEGSGPGAGGPALDPDEVRIRQEWVDFARQCSSDDDLMHHIAGVVQEEWRIMIEPCLVHLPLRKEVRLLFSGANVRFECVGVRIGLRDQWPLYRAYC